MGQRRYSQWLHPRRIRNDLTRMSRPSRTVSSRSTRSGRKTKKSRQRKMVKSAWQRRLSKKPPPGITECAECGTKPKRLHEVFGAEAERWVCGECLGFLLKARRASREPVVEGEEGR